MVNIKKLWFGAICIALVISLAVGVSAQTLEMQMVAPSGICENEGKLYVADERGKAIHIFQNSQYTVFTGEKVDIKGVDGISLGGYNDAKYDEALFENPWGIVPFAKGIAVSDSKNNAIRLLLDGEVYTLAGGKDADKSEMQEDFNQPTGIAADENGNLYVADTGNNIIRKIDEKGNVSFFAGSKAYKGGRADGANDAALFYEPTGLSYLNNALYVADSGNNRICKIENGMVSTIAGKEEMRNEDGICEGGFIDGNASEAMFANPQGVLAIEDVLYIADTGNGAIRKLKNGEITTELMRTKQDDLSPVSPRGMVAIDTRLYICDVFSRDIIEMQIERTQKPQQPQEENAASSAPVTSDDLSSQNEAAPQTNQNVFAKMWAAVTRFFANIFG